MTNLEKVASVLASVPSVSAFAAELSDKTKGCHGLLFGTVWVFRTMDGFQFHAMDEVWTLAEAADRAQHRYFLATLARNHLAEA